MTTYANPQPIKNRYGQRQLRAWAIVKNLDNDSYYTNVPDDVWTPTVQAWRKRVQNDAWTSLGKDVREPMPMPYSHYYFTEDAPSYVRVISYGRDS